MNLFEMAFAAKLPMLGICRGHQVINVALGGTLCQHIPDAHGVSHYDVMHEVRFAPDSRLAAILQADVLTVNSFHHQSVENVAPPPACGGHVRGDQRSRGSGRGKTAGFSVWSGIRNAFRRTNMPSACSRLFVRASQARLKRAKVFLAFHKGQQAAACALPPCALPPVEDIAEKGIVTFSSIPRRHSRLCLPVRQKHNIRAGIVEDQRIQFFGIHFAICRKHAFFRRCVDILPTMA